MGSAEGVRKGWTPERRAAQSARWKNRALNPTVGRPKGTKNKNPYPRTEAVIARLAIQPPPPSWAGKKHSEETKQKMSEKRTAYIEKHGLTMAYQGLFKPRHPEKYMGDPSKIVYRSSWELKCMMHFDDSPSILSWASEEFCIPYWDPSTKVMRRYFPDFLIKAKQVDGSVKVSIIEVKPAKETIQPTSGPRKTRKRLLEEVTTYATNTAKWNAAEAFAKERGWTFVILTEKEIFGKSP